MKDDTEPKRIGKSQNKTSKSSIDDDRLKRIEQCVAKMAHYSGTERILDEFGIDRWVPGKKDMSKRRD